MTEIPGKTFSLRWHQHDAYIISLMAAHSGDIPVHLVQALQNAGMQAENRSLMSIRAPRQWKPVWDKLYAALEQSGGLDVLDAAVMPAFDTMEMTEFRPLSLVHAIAKSLWLGDALLQNRVVCYLQPVLDAKGQIFGYESFVRVGMQDGTVIGGENIIAASRALGIEYVIDRHLHVQAIKTFVSSAFNGFLFVNLFPGFIHRPEVYLEGLSETARKLGIAPGHIVLDVTRAESPHDTQHVKSVCDYARSRGMAVALDDMESLAGARKLVPEIRPDFVKLDSKLTRQAETPSARETIRLIAALAHEAGGRIIAEGVETQGVYDALVTLGIDLFQGYLFSPPMPVEAALNRAVH